MAIETIALVDQSNGVKISKDKIVTVNLDKKVCMPYKLHFQSIVVYFFKSHEHLQYQ